MTIGLLALSGVRACDPELLAVGLTLPAFVQRSQVIASLPSLGLLYLAACTPPGHALRYFEAEADGKEPADLYRCDLVAISTFSAQVFEAYAIADRLRAAGVRVAIGGLHASVLPDEAAQHADYVIVGEAENVWPHVVAAAAQGAPPRVFRATYFPPVEVAQLPVPRYDLLKGRTYNRYTVQTSRGCPWRCDFCASSVMLSRRYRRRPPEHVIRDVRAIQQINPRPFIEFADDNTFVDHAWGRELCEQLAPLRTKWFTETDITIADDPALLDAMRRSGCRQVLIGLESPSRQGVDGIELRRNVKARWADHYADAIETIQSHGVTVNGCFILGLDSHGPEIFDEVFDFAMRTGLYEVQITLLTPFPGTPLYERLKREGRLLHDGAWNRCTLFDVNFIPKNMTPEQLRLAFRELGQRIYASENVERRRAHFHRLHRSCRSAPMHSM